MNPASSSSIVSTEIVVSASPSKSSSVFCESTEIVMVEFWLPSIKYSLNASTGIICSVSQLLVVNVMLPITVTSSTSSEVTVNTTSVIG